MPLPPYIAAKRAQDERDRTDYQTVYARLDGSVAAPTAGLHFTPDLMKRLESAGVAMHFVTLHVGAGTFLPVKVDDVSEHKMHPEFGEVSQSTAPTGSGASPGKTVATEAPSRLFTTSARTLRRSPTGARRPAIRARR